MLSVPTTAEPLLTGTPTTPGLLAPATALLASSILPILAPTPLALDKLIGFGPAAEAFLSAWSSLLASRGLRVRIDTGARAGAFGSRVSYATRASLPPPPRTPFPHAIVQARATPADLDALAQLYIAFQLDTPWRGVVTRDAALAFVERPVRAGLVFLVRAGGDADGEAVGYVLLGRVTPRTIAIRNVYVQPSHRRQGIAEAMVRGATRYFLSVPPHGMQLAHDGPPAVGFKAEVNLNVADAGAERVYRRAGFLFPDRSGDADGPTGGVDPATGRKGWYESLWRAVVPEDEPSSEA